MSSDLGDLAATDQAADAWLSDLQHEPACGCAACASIVESAGDGLSGLPGEKPAYSLSQIVGALNRAGSAWPNGAVIGYSFRDAAPPGLDAAITFRPLSTVERELARQAFETISDLVNLRFVELADNGLDARDGRRIYLAKDDAAPDYEWGRASRWSTATPNGKIISASDIWLSTDSVAQRSWFVGGYNFHALMHEIGHALGLSHPGPYNADGSQISYAANAAYAQDSRQFSMMSYFSASNTGADHVVDSKGGSYSSATPLLHDIAALQAVYGPNMSARAGDTVYGYNSTASRASYDFVRNPTPIFTIWDAGGTDWLDFSLAPARVNVDLNAGAFSDALEMTNNISIAYGVVIENGRGGKGNDFFAGNPAANRLEGGDGADELGGRDGDDVLLGDGGDDALWGDAGRDSLLGGAGDDRLFGGANDDFLAGEDGRDILDGGDGADVMGGREGDDVVFGGGGDDTLWGDAGRDSLFGGAGDDRLYGGTDDDFLAGEDGRDTLDGGDGADVMGGREGDDVVFGGGGDDTLWGDAGRDSLFGGAGDDRLYGGTDDDFLAGEDGRDILDGGDGADVMGGREGDDLLFGGGGDDALWGDAGRDSLFGGNGDDRLYGGADDDLLAGEDGRDILDGGDAADVMGGREGDDILFGGGGDDILWGDAGGDRLVGGGGQDRLTGGLGADVFIFSADDSRRSGPDLINDFNGYEDLIDLSAIDADRLTAWDDAFRFVGQFTGRAAEAVLSYDVASNRSTLNLDTDGDQAPDFVLLLAGAHSTEFGWTL